MKTLLFILLSALFISGCSKDGSKSKVIDGGEIVIQEPTPTDTNMPELK